MPPEPFVDDDSVTLTAMEREIPEYMVEGSAVSLVGYAPEGSAETEGWYIFLDLPDGRSMLLISTNKPKPKYSTSEKSIRALFKGLGVKNINFPLMPDIHNHRDVWEFFAKKNNLCRIKS